MLAHERGLISVEKVQRINKKGVNIKYKAEVSSQTYRDAIGGLNSVIKRMPDDYNK
jgi:hypothetical protein